MSADTKSPTGIKERSAETEALRKRLIRLEIGEVITYEALSAEIGGDDSRGAHLQSARRIAEAGGVFFETVRGIGVKRIPDGRVAEIESTFTVRKFRRVAKRTVKRLTAVAFDSLNQDERLSYQMAMATAGAVGLLARQKQQNLLEQRIRDGADAKTLDVSATLNLFTAKNGKGEVPV